MRADYDLGHAETITGPRSHRVGVLGLAYSTFCVREPEPELRFLVDIAQARGVQYLVELVRDRLQQSCNRVFADGDPCV